VCFIEESTFSVPPIYWRFELQSTNFATAVGKYYVEDERGNQLSYLSELLNQMDEIPK
jgi:hypothetical protein